MAQMDEELKTLNEENKWFYDTWLEIKTQNDNLLERQMQLDMDNKRLKDKLWSTEQSVAQFESNVRHETSASE